jgi:hypothetical protein
VAGLSPQRVSDHCVQVVDTGAALQPQPGQG